MATEPRAAALVAGNESTNVTITISTLLLEALVLDNVAEQLCGMIIPSRDLSRLSY
jgi:hypothetical protein